MPSEPKVPVQILTHKGRACMVSYMDAQNSPVRVIVDSSVLLENPDGTTGLVEKKDIEQGIPYGIPWETALPNMTVTRESLAGALRRHGIYEPADVRYKAAEVLVALQEAFRLDYDVIIAIAKQYDRRSQ